MGTRLTLETENALDVDVTLEAWRALHAQFPATGIAVQAALTRTPGDCADLAAAGARVRLSKGTARGARAGALERPHDIDRAYVRCLRRLVDDGADVVAATHDPRLLEIARAGGGRVAAVATEDTWQVEGANDRVQLQALGAELNRRIVEGHMRAGTTVVDPATTWIDATVTLEPDTTLLPGTQLHGATRVAEDAVVGPDTTLTDVSVGPGATVTRTHGSESEVRAGASVGPFAYLRPGTVLGEDGKIGTFVETKKSTIGRGSKVPHLSYVGDATIGENSNIGAASVFVNYDGVNKHRTSIGNDVRMGPDNMYVAPVTVGDGAYSGAGTTVRKDVPAGALVLTEGRQVIVEGWVQKHRPGTAAARAAEAAQESDRGA